MNLSYSYTWYILEGFSNSHDNHDFIIMNIDIVLVTWVGIIRNYLNTVYSFEFAQSYFHPTKISDWFAESWIRSPSNFII